MSEGRKILDLSEKNSRNWSQSRAKFFASKKFAKNRSSRKTSAKNFAKSARKSKNPQNPKLFAKNKSLPETKNNMFARAKKQKIVADFREKIKQVFAKNPFVSGAALVAALVIITGVGWAFFSDMLSGNGDAKAGCLQITPTLKIDGESGNALNVPNLQSSASCIPAKYQTVEYLNLDGKSWFATGENDGENFAMSADFSIDANSTTENSVFGAYNGAAGSNYFRVSIFGEKYAKNPTNAGSSDFIYSSNGGTYSLSHGAGVDSARHKILFDTKSGWNLDGVAKTAAPTVLITDANSSEVLLGAAGNTIASSGITGAGNIILGKLYSSQIWRDGNLVRNFIPVYDKEADECLLYDTVSQKPFENKGTGKITCPNPNAKKCGIPPAGATAYKKVDFVTFSGAQFINTGITATGENMELSAKASFDATASSMSTIFGSSASGDFGGVWAFRYGNDAIFARYGGTSPGNISPLVNDTPYTVEYKTGEGFFVNGTKKMAEASGVARPTVEVPIYLGANNKSNTVAQNFLVGNVYSFAITKGDVSLNLIPVQDDAGNYGFFDTVSNKFFANLGTGNLTGATPSENAEIYYADFGKADPLACGGQNQGETAGKVAVNEIHDFSYKLQNTGTVDYKNYTGDKISAWLDYDYVPVDYVQFSGAQYLDTKINQTGDIKVFADFQYSAAPASGAIIDLFGAGLLGNSNSFAFGYNNQLGNNNEFVANYRAASSTGFATGDLARHTITKTNGTTVLTNVAGATKTNVMADNFITAPAVNISLGRITNVANRDFVGKVYAFSIEKSGEKVRDLIPVKNLKTQECGFFDKVSGEFFANLGTGDLICGAEIANSTPKILLYSPSVSDATIQSDISAVSAGAVSSSAISAINGAECLANFAGNNNQNVISPVCQTGILSGTLNAETAVNEFYNSPNYKFAIAVSPEFAEIYAKVKINFGVSSGAQGLTAVNWREVVNPYVGANLSVPKGAPPIISAVANKNLTPFVGQVVADSATPDPAKKQMKKSDYLKSLVSATDAEDDCAFSGANSACEIAVADEGGFDANKPGKYQITYSATDSDGNSASEFVLTVEVWNFVKISSGNYGSAALASNGDVYVWGFGANYRLGTNSTTDIQVPTKLTTLSNIVDISMAQLGGHAVDADGNLWAWGNNDNSSLGDGTTTGRRIPVKIAPPAGKKYVQVSQFYYSGAVLADDGTVYTWGWEGYGATGHGQTGNKFAPTQLTELSNIVKINMGYFNGAAIDADGNLWNWGTNGEMQLGMGCDDGCVGNGLTSTIYHNKPAKWSGMTNVKDVAYGQYHAAAIKNDGTVWGWGTNSEGRVGTGSTNANTATPLQLSGVSNATKVTSNEINSAVITSGGDYYAWGSNNYGETGYASGNTTAQYSPIKSTQIPAGTKIKDAAFAYDSSFVLTDDGKIIYGFGYGGDYVLGTNSTASSSAISQAAFVPPALN